MLVLVVWVALDGACFSVSGGAVLCTHCLSHILVAFVTLPTLCVAGSCRAVVTSDVGVVFVVVLCLYSLYGVICL